MPMNKDSTLIFYVSSFQADIVDNDEECLNTSSTKMEKPKVGPSEQSIDNIMNFARSYEALETEETGHVEMILN